MSNKPILEVIDLGLTFSQYTRGLRKKELTVIKHLNLTLCEGEILAVVGASGSGKSLLAHAILEILPQNSKVSGELRYEGEVLTQSKKEKLRGKEITLIPQSVNYLDPLHTVDQQLRLSLTHMKATDQTAAIKTLLCQYELPEEVRAYYPHQLSGGMARKVLLSMAMAVNSKVMIADEPTPGLDSLVRETVLADFRAAANSGKAVLLITHDLDAALKTADRVAVFHSGSILETANIEDFSKSGIGLKHPYTKALFRALPTEDFISLAGSASPSDTGLPDSATLLEAKGVDFGYSPGKLILKNVNFSVKSGQVVGLFAPSGFGKTTLAKLLAGYLKPKAGKITIDGAELSGKPNFHPVQLIFQHPEKAVNPKWKMSQIISESGEPSDTLLSAMGIKKEWLSKWPTELSGGELQRFCVLRALTKDTKFLIADEITTMLDTITQAQIWAVVLAYAKKHQIGLVLISHDRPLLRRLCDQIIDLS